MRHSGIFSRGTPLTLAVVLILTGALAACNRPMADASAPADKASAPRFMTIGGEGFVTAEPDLALTTIGIVTQGTSAAEALAANNERMSALLDLIKSLGIESKDVQTTNLQVSPRYTVSDPTQPRSEPIIAGYDASNDLTVRIRDLSKLGAALDKFVTVAGANNLKGLSFDFANPEPLLDIARKNAVIDAKRKAALYAEAAGVKLGPVQSISEGGASYPQPIYAREKFMAMASSVPVATGESRLNASVTLTFVME